VNAVTPADRARWQRQSARTLAAVLDAHPNLPALGLHPRRYDTPDHDRSYLHACGAIDATRVTITAVIDRTR
jgi:hypothetical protein